MLKMISEESGFSESLVEFVVNNFETNLRFFLANPALVGKKILLKNFGVFNFSVEKMEKRRKYIRDGTDRADYYDSYLKKYSNSNSNSDKDEQVNKD